MVYKSIGLGLEKGLVYITGLMVVNHDY